LIADLSYPRGVTSPLPLKPRLLLFAFGDFAFNLYWQSIMLFLLFYYTEALGLPVTTAAAIYTDRQHLGRDRQFRRGRDHRPARARGAAMAGC
jgi:hypothetical protein